jgi:hypothetical protein
MLVRSRHEKVMWLLFMLLSEPYPLAFIMKKRKIDINFFHYIGQRSGVGARTGATSCWGGSGMKKSCSSGSVSGSDPILWQ